jgi:hypothetical protein
MEIDETTPEEQLESTPSVEKQNDSTVSEDENTLEGPVPYSRFKEVIDEKNSFKTDLDSLKEEIANLKAKEPEVEEEPSDWKELKERAVKEALTTFERKQLEKEQKAKEVDNQIADKLADLKAIGQEINPQIEKAIYAKLIETGSTDVVKTFLKVKAEMDKKIKTDEIKSNAQTPSSNKGSEAKSFSYNEIHNKSLDELLAEA